MGFVRFILSIMCTLGLVVHGGSALAADTDMTIHKKDSSFRGTVSAYTLDVADGFIANIELNFVWSAIFDQPTEIYAFKWERSGGVNYGGARYTRDTLSEYPDLQRRLDELRPGNIELQLNVIFAAKHPGYTIPIGGECEFGFVTRGQCQGSLNKTITEVPHLIVAASGQEGIDIIPSSPEDDWVGFFDTSHLQEDEKTLNKKLHDMMKRTEVIYVRDLSLVSYTLPYAEISSIFEAYHQREFEKEEEDLAEGEGVQANQLPHHELSDRKKSNNGFWDGLADKTSTTQQKTASGDRFWDGFDEKPVKEEAAPLSSGGSVKQPSGSAPSVIIERHGVKNSAGEVLIPYRDDWTIGSYEDGLAEVSMESQSVTDARISDCGTVKSYFRNYFFVDKDGTRLTPPREKWFKSVTTKKTFLTKKDCPSWECGYERANAVMNENKRIRAAERRCKSALRKKLAEVRKRYESSN